MIDPVSPDYTCTPAAEGRPAFDYRPESASAQPLVTVITPFWNNARELFHETARCVLNQSLQQLEWLIINDAATDPEALAILDQYRNCDPRVRVIDNPVNLGLAGARNVGFNAARSDFVFVLDDDDLIEPTTLEKAYWFLLSHPEYAVVNSWVVGFGGQTYLWRKGFDTGEEMLKANNVTSIAMVRRSAFQQVGGYDAEIRGGLEDWEFWLRLADAGLWGATLPEFLTWYRRRPSHADRWQNLDDTARQGFVDRLRAKFPRLYAGGFPRVEPRWPMPYEEVARELPCENPLTKSKPRLLLLVPWLQMGGADKFNLDLLEQLTRAGWEVTIAATKQGNNNWLAEFTRYTPDVFVLHHFLRGVDAPTFLRYLIRSRRPDVVLITNSELGYLLLPYLRAVCPEPRYVDFCHMEEEYWKNGGYPRYAVASQPLLDLNIVSSEHLRQWMVQRGADPAGIEVSYTNIDPEVWRPDATLRERTRAELGLAPDVPVILYAARICDQKQPNVFARVMQQLAAQGLTFQTLVAGDGPDRPALEAFIAEHGLERCVRMLGPIPQSRMHALMCASDIFFLPSRWEGIALSIYQAMACGLAVVGADVGGQRELVTPDCGILHSRAEPDIEVAAYTESLAGLLTDPNRLRTLGRQARERICGQFTLDEMGRRMIGLIERTLAAPSHVPPLVPQATAFESATRAVEYTRIWELTEQLWRDRDYLRSENERLNGEARRLAAAWDAQAARTMELDRLKDQLWNELQTYVARVRELEQQVATMQTQLERRVVGVVRRFISGR